MTLLAEAFPQITIKYKFDDLSKTHVVELSPIEEYYNNPSLENAWINLTKSFWEQFPGEAIAFISTDFDMDFENPEFTFNLESSLLIAVQE